MLIVVESGVVFNCFIVVGNQQLSVFWSTILFHFGFKVVDPLNDLLNIPILHGTLINLCLLEFPLFLILLVKLDLGVSQVTFNALDTVVRILMHLHVQNPRVFLAGESFPEKLNLVVGL